MFTVDISFTIWSNFLIIRSFISSSLLSYSISVMYLVKEHVNLAWRDSSSFLIICFISTLKSSSRSFFNFVTLSFSKITSDWKMSFELWEFFVTRSRVVKLPMEIFEGDHSSKEDGTFLCVGEFRKTCGVASNKETCIPWLWVYIDSRGVVGDAAGGECVESVDIFIIGSLILSLFIRSVSLFHLGLLSNVPFFSNLSILSCKWSPVISLKTGVFVTSLCIALISARLGSFRILVTA